MIKHKNDNYHFAGLLHSTERFCCALIIPEIILVMFIMIIVIVTIIIVTIIIVIIIIVIIINMRIDHLPKEKAAVTMNPCQCLSFQLFF